MTEIRCPPPRLEDRCRLSRLEKTLFMNRTRGSTRVFHACVTCTSIPYSTPLQMHRALTFIAEETCASRGSIDRKRLARRFYIRAKENGRGVWKKEGLAIYFRLIHSAINFPRSRFPLFFPSDIKNPSDFEINNSVRTSLSLNSFFMENFFS